MPTPVIGAAVVAAGAKPGGHQSPEAELDPTEERDGNECIGEAQGRTRRD